MPGKRVYAVGQFSHDFRDLATSQADIAISLIGVDKALGGGSQIRYGNNPIPPMEAAVNGDLPPAPPGLLDAAEG